MFTTAFRVVKRTDPLLCNFGVKNANDFDVFRWKMEGDLSPRREGIFRTDASGCFCITHCLDDFCDAKKLNRAFCLETVPQSGDGRYLTQCTGSWEGRKGRNGFEPRNTRKLPLLTG